MHVSLRLPFTAKADDDVGYEDDYTDECEDDVEDFFVEDGIVFTRRRRRVYGDIGHRLLGVRQQRIVQSSRQTTLIAGVCILLFLIIQSPSLLDTMTSLPATLNQTQQQWQDSVTAFSALQQLQTLAIQQHTSVSDLVTRALGH